MNTMVEDPTQSLTNKAHDDSIKQNYQTAGSVTAEAISCILLNSTNDKFRKACYSKLQDKSTPQQTQPSIMSGISSMTEVFDDKYNNNLGSSYCPLKKRRCTVMSSGEISFPTKRSRRNNSHSDIQRFDLHSRNDEDNMDNLRSTQDTDECTSQEDDFWLREMCNLSDWQE
ncbi:uncharacterized protein [Hyperolius riggenbachi]|uniref:uncharacterized protein isoform X3 n=1 Tax=Hyperolius riggenbachi TaxID=752182 RepID=UPI0035A3C1E3